MFQAGLAAAFADRLVEPIFRTSGTKLREIALAKPLDGFGGELHLAHRHEIKRLHLACRALGFRIKAADGFQCVAEKIKPHRLGKPRRV